MTTQPKVALITGVTGQDGSYLAELLLAIDDSSKSPRMRKIEQLEEQKQ